jgi:hypothetical protein
MPDEDSSAGGRAWHDTERQAAAMAVEKWISLRSNRDLGAYEIQVAAGNLPDPAWPNLTFEEILNIAFKGRIIDSADHPVIRQLRGEL